MWTACTPSESGTASGIVTLIFGVTSIIRSNVIGIYLIISGVKGHYCCIVAMPYRTASVKLSCDLLRHLWFQLR